MIPKREADFINTAPVTLFSKSTKVKSEENRTTQERFKIEKQFLPWISQFRLLTEANVFAVICPGVKSRRPIVPKRVDHKCGWGGLPELICSTPSR